MYQRAGAIFPQKPERSGPVFTPSQTQPSTSHPQSLRNTDQQTEAPESSLASDLPPLRYTNQMFSSQYAPYILLFSMQLKYMLILYEVNL